MSVSVLILTLDEEQNLPGCLESLDWCDDVVVLDSFSTDATIRIAETAGARVVQRAFDDYAAQRNHALTSVDFRHPWVLMLDADERVPPALRDEMLAAVATAGESVALFEMRRKDYFLGRWLRRSSGYPTWFGRVLRRGRVRFERAYNEQPCPEGERRPLREHLDHHPYNKGFSHWLAKHDRYSTMEARLQHAQGIGRWRWSELLAGDAARRRQAQKGLLYSLPGRPLLAFAALYFVRGGILEGRAGLIACALRGIYEFLIDCKRLEIRRRERGLPI